MAFSFRKESLKNLGLKIRTCLANARQNLVFAPKIRTCLANARQNLVFAPKIKPLFTLTGWRQFFRILTKKEKIAFGAFLTIFLISAIFLGTNLYLKNTAVVAAEGGSYQEGIIGNPRFINPISAANDVDRDLVELIFSGLMKYNSSGEIVPDLIKDYKVNPEGTIYELELRENALWHDGEKVTADDVIFTIQAIQDPSYKSPQRANWLGVETEKISESKLKLKIQNPYGAFLERLTLKILPAHIWKEVPVANFFSSVYNLAPIGSGPFELKKVSHDQLGYIQSVQLERNEKFYRKKPFISKLTFYFFDSEEKLIKAAQNKEIDGFSLSDPRDCQKIKNLKFKNYSPSVPRYFLISFNPSQSKILKEKEVRLALNYGTNKEEILKEILGGEGKIIDSPILPQIYGFDPPSKIYQFDSQKAEQILEEAGFKKNEKGLREKTTEKNPTFKLKSNLRKGSKGTEVEELQKCLRKDSEIYPGGEVTGYFGKDTEEAIIRFKEKHREEISGIAGYKIKCSGLVGKGTRTILNKICFSPTTEVQSLQFSLKTVDQPFLTSIANQLKKQWGKLGIEVEVKTFDSPTLEREIIKPRNYEALLFGEVLGIIPDPFPFWHSSQRGDPGLNLAIYENEKSDKLLEEARRSQDPEKTKENLQQFQNILIEDAPAIFLCSPNYLYLVSEKIKGIDLKIIADPSERFSGIENWHLKTKRIWKKSH